jgi:hypothetical protein
MAYVVRHGRANPSTNPSKRKSILLLYPEEALAGHIAFLAARGGTRSPAYVIWRRGGDLESSLRYLGPAGDRLKGNLESGLFNKS